MKYMGMEVIFFGVPGCLSDQEISFLVTSSCIKIQNSQQITWLFNIIFIYSVTFRAINKVRAKIGSRTFQGTFINIHICKW